MMTPTTLMNIIRATGSTRVANDVADLRLAQALPTATPAPAVQRDGQASLRQTPSGSSAPSGEQAMPTTARAPSMEPSRPVAGPSTQRAPQTAPVPSGLNVPPQGPRGTVEHNGAMSSVPLMRSFFQSLPAPVTQATGATPAPQPMQQGGAPAGRARPIPPQPSDAAQGADVETPRSMPSAGIMGRVGSHPAMAQLDRVLDQLAAQFVPRGPKAPQSSAMPQPNLQSAAAALSRPVTSFVPLPVAAFLQAGPPHPLSPQQHLTFPNLAPLLRDATLQVISHPNLSPVLPEFMQAGGITAPLGQPVPQSAPMPRSDVMAAAITTALGDANEAMQSASISTPQPTTPTVPVSARDLSILVAMNAAMIPGFPNLMSSQTASALRSRDLGQKLADLAHKLRTMDPQEQRLFLAGLHLPLRVLNDLQRQAKKWARQLGDTITPDTIEGFLLLCLTVLGWPTTVAEYLWYCLTATDDPDDIATYNRWNG